MSEDKSLTVKAPLPIGSRGIELESFEALWRFAQCVAASPFAPRGMEKAEAIVPAIQLGLEIGLSPMSALQNVAVINGRPGIYGDAALALVRASGRCEAYSQNIEGEGDKRTATVVSKRDDADDPITTTFSVADAKRAGLWGKQGPWSQYPDRMLLFRARGFNLRDNFGDILKGLSTLEELRDHEIKPVEGRTLASADIKFGPAGIENNAEVHAEETKKRKRRTKAEMEAAKNLGSDESQNLGKTPSGSEDSAQTNAEASVDEPTTPAQNLSPLESLQATIAASPIPEDQFVRHLVAKMILEPHQKLIHLPDERLIAINEGFSDIAKEILDVE